MELALNEACAQEARHAVLVKKMLIATGAETADTIDSVIHTHYDAMGAMLRRTTKGQEPHMAAVIRIALNQHLESRFAEKGVHEAHLALTRLAKAIRSTALMDLAQTFHVVVQADETYHVQIDERILAIIGKYYVIPSCEEIIKNMRSRGSAFNRAIRAKFAFMRAADAYASEHGAGERQAASA